MPTEMTLTLKLKGVSQLIQSIQALNNALNIVNSKFNIVANNIGKAAQQISQSATQLRASGAGVGLKRTSIVGGSNAGLQQFDQQHLGSVLFSAIAGAWDIMGAKIATRMSTMFAQKWLANHPLNPQRPGISSNPIGAGAKWDSYLAQLGNKFLLAGLAIFAFIKAMEIGSKLFMEVIKGLMSYGQLLFSRGGYGVSGELKGIAAGFGMDAKDVAAQANRTPGGARAFIQKLKMLRNAARTNPDLATYMADSMGMSDFLPGLATKSDKEFNKMFNQKPIKPSDVKAAVDFNSALGELKMTLMELGTSLTPVIEYVTFLVKWIKTLANVLNWFVNNTSIVGWVKRVQEMLDRNQDRQDKTNKDLKDAINQFTDKIGTYGGAERARGPVPRGWGQYNYQKEMIDQAEKLGAFEY